MSELTSNPTETPTNLSDRSQPPRSPKAVLSVSREEFYGQDPEHQPLELIVQERRTEEECPNCSPEDLFSDKCWKLSQLPADLYGHVFIVGSVGCFDSPQCEGSDCVVEPAKGGWTSLINGEGMIYRLDFHQCPQIPTAETGKAWMVTRIVKTPDHYADLALGKDGDENKYKQKWPNEYGWLKFNNFFLSRLSLKLGARNYLNTAFLPMKFSDGTERLLVTWDAGRPYEVDPQTLGLVGPIGWNWQWHPVCSLLPPHVFPITLSAAHAVFDTHSDEMFTVNGIKSLRTFFSGARILTFYPQNLLEKFFNKPYLREWLKKVFNLLILGLRLFLDFAEIIGRLLVNNSRDSVYLKRWKGKGTSVEEWQVLREDGLPLKVYQSLHQLAITRDYILLSDAAFKISINNLIPSLNSQKRLVKKIDKLLKKLRKYLTYPQLPYTNLYIIPRNQLRSDVKTVKAKRVKIAPETAHFLAEYENLGTKIIVHVAHTAASDPAAFLNVNDRSIYDCPELNKALKARTGMFASVMDASRLGSWVLDAKQETCKSVFLPTSDSYQYLWAIALYAWRGFQPQKFTDIYWNCWGVWPELLSKSIFDMYKNYKERLVAPLEMVEDIIKNGRRANLIRMHIDREQSIPSKLSIADAYHFPPGSFGNSPEFVPRSDTEDSTAGYIVCVVLHSDNLVSNKSELWIFDGKNLSAGPRYRLSHPRLNMGVTIHTTWLSKLEAPPIREDYSVRKDYQDAVNKTRSEAIKTLFEQDVYPHFES